MQPTEDRRTKKIQSEVRLNAIDAIDGIFAEISKGLPDDDQYRRELVVQMRDDLRNAINSTASFDQRQRIYIVSYLYDHVFQVAFNIRSNFNDGPDPDPDLPIDMDTVAKDTLELAAYINSCR